MASQSKTVEEIQLLGMELKDNGADLEVEAGQK
jgi:hypothetical protein